MAWSRRKKTTGKTLVKSSDEMRQELQYTLSLVTENIASTQKKLVEENQELQDWKDRFEEAERCTKITREKKGKEAFQMLAIQAENYVKTYRNSIQGRKDLLNRMMAQQEELQQTADRLEVDLIQNDLRRSIVSNGYISPYGNTLSETYTGQDVQRVIHNSKALLELKELSA